VVAQRGRQFDVDLVLRDDGAAWPAVIEHLPGNLEIWSEGRAMQRAWLFDTLSVTIAEVDFHDPQLRDDPGARERGVRVEMRPMASEMHGTVYVSETITLLPAICRIDLLESRPGAADRMHWHPVMHSGEPGDRTFEAAMSADPIRWLSDRLRNLDELLQATHPDVAARHAVDSGAVSRVAEEISDTVRGALEACRMPWPDVEHDERGMAIPGAY